MAKNTKRPQIYLATHKRVKSMAKQESRINLAEFYNEILNLGITQYEINKLKGNKQ